MTIEAFDSHLRDSAPGFRCYASGNRSKEANLLVRVKNFIGQPASAQDTALAIKLLGNASPALKRFAELHDGVILYQDSKSDAAGVEFFRVAEWSLQTKEMRESMAAMGVEASDMPDWFNRGIAIGQIPHSANYFVMQPDGDDAGKVFYCDHDDFKTEALASSFEALLSVIVENPPGFLYDCGCYTRYSDGKTDKQWIPKVYVPDCSAG